MSLFSIIRFSSYRHNTYPFVFGVGSALDIGAALDVGAALGVGAALIVDVVLSHPLLHNHLHIHILFLNYLFSLMCLYY